MKQSEPDALIVFENLFKISEKGFLPLHVFDEALAIYKELTKVRDKLHSVENSFPVTQINFKHEFTKEESFL